MTSNENQEIRDPGLYVLASLLRVHSIGVAPEQIRHRFGGVPIGVTEMLRCAKDFGLKARERSIRWEGLASMPMPAIAAQRDGGFLLLGKASEDRILVQRPYAPRPEFMTRAQFETVFDGRVVLMTRRAGLVDLSRRFDITWFIGAIHKYRRLLGEVLVASFFLQLFALVSPLVLSGGHRQGSGASQHEHARRARDWAGRRSRSLRAILGILRTYLFCAHDQPHRRRARRPAVPPFARACRSPIFRRGASAIQWRACASWKISAIS